MKKLVKGLKDLFDFDLVHRDLKLANIFLNFPTISGVKLNNSNAPCQDLLSLSK